MLTRTVVDNIAIDLSKRWTLSPSFFTTRQHHDHHCSIFDFLLSTVISASSSFTFLLVLLTILRKSLLLCYFFIIMSFSLEYSVGKVLEVVVQLCGERVHGSVDHGVDQRVQLALRQVHVEPGAHVLHSHGRGREAGQRGAWKAEVSCYCNFQGTRFSQ